MNRLLHGATYHRPTGQLLISAVRETVAIKATLLTKPDVIGFDLCHFDCVFDEPRPSYAVCNCFTTNRFAESTPSIQELELHIGSKVILHESEIIKKSGHFNLFWIDRIEKR